MQKSLTTALIIIMLPFLFGNSTNGQKPVSDTSDYPYWINMMQDQDANFYATQSAFRQYWKDRKITKGCGYKVFKRWEYMAQQRVLPDGTLPKADAIMNAWNSVKDNSISGSGAWINLGPSTLPSQGLAGYTGLGRVNTVAFHPTDPNKFYIGAPAGGLWQTTDGGATWITHTDTMPSLGVSAIVVNYANPDIMLMGTGDRDAGDAPGMGVYKSTDGGLSWVAAKTGMNNKTVGRIIQHPVDPQIFLAATSGGVYRTTDGAASWTLTQSGNFKDIHFKPGNPSIVYAAAGSDFYRSTNNGVTFIKITAGITTGQRGVIAVTPANPDYVYFMQSDNSSGFKSLYRSTNSGVTFTEQSNSPNILDWSCDGGGTGGQGWYDLALAADPVDPQVIYAGGVDVWKSTDGGVTWSINSHWWGDCSVPSVHADCHFLTFSPVDSKIYAANDGGIYSSSNGGTTWTDHTSGITIGQIYKLSQSQTVREKVLNGFQDNGSYAMTPTDWIAVGGGDGMECAVDYTNASRTYHTIYYGDIFRKVNNVGEVRIAGNGAYGIDESGAWVTPFTLSKSDNKMMFVGYKNIWRSNDVTGPQITWTRISSNLAGSNGTDMSAIEHSSANPNILYAVRSDKKLFRTDNCMNDNPLWYDLTSFLPVSATAADIKTNPSDENIVYAALNNNVYKSTDKGMSWTDISGNLPEIHINSIALYANAPEGLYVGTDAGVFYKDSTTSGWIPFSDGLPVNVKITELDIYYDNDSVSRDALRASTYGRGLWGSDLYHSAPQAEFSASKTTIPIYCSIDFNDQSRGIPTDFLWSFPGATPSTSKLKNPTGITYPTAGTYEVKLKVWNSLGSDSLVKSNYITVSSSLLPVADFSADKRVLCLDEAVHLYDKSDNCPAIWNWQFSPSTVEFLDGTNTDSQNPVVRFLAPGTYDVSLTTYNSIGPGTTTKLNYISHGGFSLPFSEKFSGGFSDNYWEVINPDLLITWDTISVTGTTPGSKAAWMNFFKYGNVDRRDQLISPPMNFNGFGIVSLNFRHAYEQRIRKDSLIIKCSDDCGNTWKRIWAMGPNGTPDMFVTHPSTMNEFFPQSADDWCSGSYGVSCYTIDLSQYGGKNNVKLMFESFNRYGNNLFINDITINGSVGTSEQTGSEPQVRIFPNPTGGEVAVSITNSRSGSELTLFNSQGATVFKASLKPTAGTITRKFDFSDLSAGVYFLSVTGDDVNVIEKLVIL